MGAERTHGAENIRRNNQEGAREETEGHAGVEGGGGRGCLASFRRDFHESLILGTRTAAEDRAWGAWSSPRRGQRFFSGRPGGAGTGERQEGGMS